jgi:hypothetical protein
VPHGMSDVTYMTSVIKTLSYIYVPHGLSSLTKMTMVINLSIFNCHMACLIWKECLTC